MNFTEFLIEKKIYSLDEKKVTTEIDFFDAEDDFKKEEPEEEELTNHDKGIIVSINILTDKFKEVFETTHDSFLAKVVQIGKESTIQAFIKKVVKHSECKFLRTFIVTNADEILQKLLASINEFLSDSINDSEVKKLKNKETADKSSATKALNKEAQVKSLRISKKESATIEAALGKTPKIED